MHPPPHAAAPTLSRWGRSSYETEADLAAEAAALSGLTRLRGTGHDAEVLVVTSQVAVNADLLDRTPSARLVLTTTSGYDHLDRGELARRGIAAGRLPEARRDAVVEAALELCLAGLRQSGWLRAEARAGRWARAALPSLGMRTLRGARVGVVGLGVIGRRMAEVLAALGARVLGHDPAGVPAGVEACDLDAMLRQVDILTLHCNLDATNRGMISARRLENARPGLILVNTARGALVDLGAAIRLLGEGHLGGLGVDVFPTEPFAGMAISAELPGLLVSPHAAGYHDGLAAAVRQGLVDSVAAWTQDGRLPHPVPLPLSPG